MSDQNVTPPASDPAATTTPPAENSTIREMRAQIDKLTANLGDIQAKESAAQAKLQEIERSKLDETERVKAEKADLEAQIAKLSPLAEEHAKLSSTVEQLYNAEIESVPEAHREQVKKLSAAGDWMVRLDNARAAKALIPAPTAVSAGTKTAVAGTVPGGAAPGAPAKNAEGAVVIPSWGDALAKHST